MIFQSINSNKKNPLMVIAAFLLLILCAFISCVNETRPTSSSSHFVSLNDIQVHYIMEGQGDKTLLFIHGWSCDTTVWKSQTDYFKKDYRVIVIDLPGHGKSSKPEIPYTFDLFAEAVRKVIDDAGANKVFLVGHSMGYPVARHFIKKWPQRVSGLCIVDGAYFRYLLIRSSLPNGINRMMSLSCPLRRKTGRNSLINFLNRYLSKNLLRS